MVHVSYSGQLRNFINKKEIADDSLAFVSSLFSLHMKKKHIASFSIKC